MGLLWRTLPQAFPLFHYFVFLNEVEVVPLKTETPALIVANNVAPLDAADETRMSWHVIDPEYSRIKMF